MMSIRILPIKRQVKSRFHEITFIYRGHTIMYNENRIVTVASVKLTEKESALISAYCKLAGTKVEAIVSELTKYFIEEHVPLQLLDQPSSNDMMKIAKTFKKND